MHFGLFFLMQRDPAWSEAAVYDAELGQMRFAEECGFESVWVAEHHFSDYGLCPAPPVLAAHVAARTQRLRVGMAVSLLPLHDPVMLAEQLAVLDQVSGGRVDVGIGRGRPGQEYEAFGTGYDESRDRIEEGITLMQRCWSGERFSFRGRFRTVEDLRVTPRPRQEPHPPLFLAANSADTDLFAARLGLPTLSSFFIPAAELRRRRTAYREEAVASGHTPPATATLLDQSWGMRVVFVAPDRNAAVAAVEGPFMAYQHRLAGRRDDGSAAAGSGAGFRPYTRLRLFEEYLNDGLAIIGSPDEVVDGLGRYAEETGFQRVMLLIALAGLPSPDALRSMELFAARVLPQLTVRHTPAAPPSHR